jgi:hypothetical protein
MRNSSLEGGDLVKVVDVGSASGAANPDGLR